MSSLLDPRRLAELVGLTPETPAPSETKALHGAEEREAIRDVLPGAVRVPLAEERVRVERRVRAGRLVRLRQRVEERSERVPLEHLRQDINVERQNIGEVVGEAKAPYYEGDVLVIPLYDERVVLQRQLVLRELVRVETKRSVRQDESVVTLRRTVVDVEEEEAPWEADTPLATTDEAPEPLTPAPTSSASAPPVR